MFFWIIIVFSSREEKFFFTCEEKFFHTLSLIKGCEEKKSERLENGYCPVEKTMIIQENIFYSESSVRFEIWTLLFFRASFDLRNLGGRMENLKF